MFFFGDAADSAQMIIEERANYSGGGPGWPAVRRENWNMRDYQKALIYSSSALRDAVYEDQPEELLNSLADLYEEYLTAFCEYSDVIRRAMDLGVHQYPWHNPDRIAKQQSIVANAKASEK